MKNCEYKNIKKKCDLSGSLIGQGNKRIYVHDQIFDIIDQDFSPSTIRLIEDMCYNKVTFAWNVTCEPVAVALRLLLR